MDSDSLTLKAFLLTLPQLGTTLSHDLQDAVHKVGQDLANHQPTVADEIRELVEQNDCLKTVYQETYDRLQSQPQPHEAVENWEAVAIPILTAHHPIAAARFMVRKVVYHWRQSAIAGNVLWQLGDSLGTSLSFVFRVAQQVEAQDIAVLKALRYNPRTVEDLSYTLGLPLEQVQAIVSALWASGEIDVVNGNLLYRLLPMLKPVACRNQTVDPHDYFTITMKGHFRLRPLISFRQREGTPG